MAIPSFTVAHVVAASSTDIQVRNANGDDFEWIKNFTYSEDSAGVGTDDVSEQITGSVVCEAIVGVNSPSHPSVSSDVSAPPTCPDLLTTVLIP